MAKKSTYLTAEAQVTLGMACKPLSAESRESCRLLGAPVCTRVRVHVKRGGAPDPQLPEPKDSSRTTAQARRNPFCPIFNPGCVKKSSFDRFFLIIKILSEAFNSLFHQSSKVSERRPTGKGPRPISLRRASNDGTVSPSPILEVDFVTKSIWSPFG